MKRYGMCMTGPNCMGIINTAERVRLNATILSDVPRRGNVAMLTQSGALGAAMQDLSRAVPAAMYANVRTATFPFRSTGAEGWSAIIAAMRNRRSRSVRNAVPHISADSGPGRSRSRSF